MLSYLNQNAFANVKIKVPQMIVEPEQRVPDFIKAGADIVSVHCEQTATIHLHRTINQVSFMQIHDRVCACFNINLATAY